MKITRLHIVNFLKLKDMEMNPTKTNVIVGKNKQGKTSILKAIRAAFDGKLDESCIRIGENKAEITIDLDELTIKRTLTGAGNYLDISNKEGMKMPAPQSFLNGILGTFSFNPIEFFEKKVSDRKKYLLNAIKLVITQEELATYTGEKLGGLDYENTHALEIVEQARKYYYDKRTASNAEVFKKEKSLQDLTSSIPEGFDPKSVDESKIKEIRDAIQKDELTKQKAEANQTHVATLQKQKTDIKGQIETLQTKLKEVQDEIVKAAELKFDFSDDLTISAAKETLAKLESQRELVFTAKRADEVRAELTTAMGEAAKLDGIVKKLTKEVPEDLIKKAKLPVEGLAIDGDNILVNGVALDNLSSSEQLKLGLTIARFLNQEFGIICIDKIETLDPESFEFFLKEIESDSNQYFITRVDGEEAKKKGYILIEDGEIKV